MNVSNNEPPLELAATQYEERMPALSPDGEWLAYVSNAPGRYEVFVSPFPVAGGIKWEVSTAGGLEPRWAHNGRELFYRNAADELVAVAVVTDPTFAVRGQTALFSTVDYLAWSYDISPDDQRFVMLERIEAPTADRELIWVDNFFTDLAEQSR